MNVIRMEGEKSTFLEELAALKAAHGSCDEVWLGIYGYSTPERHEKRAEIFARNLKAVNEAGFRGVFEMGSTLGHVPEMTETEVTKPFRKMVSLHGESMPGAFCPRGKELLAYQTAVVRRYMRHKPYAMIIDDDMRLEFRNGIPLGCFCSECVRLFNEKHGFSLTREELAEKFVTEPAFRRLYIEHNREGLADYAYALASAAKEEAPDSFVGFENCFLGAYSGGDLNHLWEALYRANGKPLISRAGAFYYKDVSPRDVLDKVLNVSYQHATMPPYIGVKRPEIENTDDTSMGKSVRGTLMEAELELAYGCTGVSIHMLNEISEPVSHMKRYFEGLSEERPYFEAITAWGRDSAVYGLRPVISPDAYLLRYIERDAYRAAADKNAVSFRWAEVPKERGRELLQIGMPLSYERGGAYLLHPAMIPYLSDAELSSLLEKNVLTDGEAISLLVERGFGKDLPLSSERMPGSVLETYLPHPLTEGICGMGRCDGFVGNSFWGLSVKKGEEDRFTALAESFTQNVWNEKGDPKRITEALVTTAKGGKWGVCGTSLFNVFINSNKRKFLLNLADELCGGMPCRLLSSEQAVVVPRVDESGAFTGVFTHSISISDSEPLTYAIRNPKTERFLLKTCDGAEKELPFTVKDGVYYVEAPVLPGYRSTLIVCGGV